MKKTRTFIAHPVPEQWKKIFDHTASDLAEGLASRIAWVKPKNMHFTLKFLGEITEDCIPDIHSALQKIPFAPFQISSAAAGFFPDTGKPRIIWRGLNQGAKEFCATSAVIDSQLSNLDFEMNQKACHAHLTLGRIKKQARDDWAALAERINRVELPVAQITNFTLYQSTLTPEGPVYSIIHKYGE